MLDTQASDAATDWPPGKIRAAIRDKRISQAALARQAGLSDGAVRTATYKSQPSAERAIAALLGVPVQEIWPSRYFPDGSSRARPWTPRNPSAPAYPPHRQNAGRA
jgi:Ner family transcriptional regulator